MRFDAVNLKRNNPSVRVAEPAQTGGDSLENTRWVVEGDPDVSSKLFWFHRYIVWETIPNPTAWFNTRGREKAVSFLEADYIHLMCYR